MFFVMSFVNRDVIDEHDGVDWSSNRTVSEMTGFSYCSKRWTYWTTFWLMFYVL